jgi:hypothetical protein
LVIDRLSVEDPQLTPLHQGIRILPRTGKLAILEFPLIFTTEVDGTLSMDIRGTVKPVAGIDLELVDFINRDHIVSTTKTAHDGFYILTEVPPGKYLIRVAPEYASKLKMISADLKTITVPPKSGFISGQDIVIPII